MSDVDFFMPGYLEEQFYNFLKHKYGDFKKLQTEADEKRKAADKMKEDNPLYHRAQVSAEMANLRVDMAAIVHRNNQLEEMLGTVEYLHQKVGILEGAYGHVKLLASTASSEYNLLAKDIRNIKKELSNAAAPPSDRADGPKG